MLELRAPALERERLRLRFGHFDPRPRHVELGHVASLPAALGEREGCAVRVDGAAHERDLLVERTQGEIRLGDLRLNQEARAQEEPFAGTRVERRGGGSLREAAEEVELVGEVGARFEQAARRTGIAVGAAPLACGGRAGADLREAIRVDGAHDRAGLRQSRGRDPDVGVGRVRARDESVEHRIGERLPPLAARLRLGRRRDGPAAVRLLESSGHFRQPLGIDLRRAHGAAGQRQDQREQCRFHGCSFIATGLRLPPAGRDASCGTSP